MSYNILGLSYTLYKIDNSKVKLTSYKKIGLICVRVDLVWVTHKNQKYYQSWISFEFLILDLSYDVLLVSYYFELYPL